MALSKSADFQKNLQVTVPCKVFQDGEFDQHYWALLKETKTAVEKCADVCKDHPCQMLAMRCLKCNVLVCVKCVANKHKCHPVIGIEVLYDNEKGILEKQLRKMEEQLLCSVMKTLTSAKHRKDEYKRKVASIKKDMEYELHEFISEASRIHKQRITQLEKIETIDLNIITEIESELIEERVKKQINRTIAEYKTLLVSGRQAEINVYSKQSDLNHIVDPHSSVPEAPTFQAVDMKNINIPDILGKLYTCRADPISMLRQADAPKIVSSFTSGLKGFTSLCMTKDGTAWIGGSQSKKLNLVDINGKIIRSRTIKKRPYCLAIMDNGDIIMTPNSSTANGIRRLCADGTEEIIYEASTSSCRGVSVTRNQEILICTSDTRVMMHDGSCTKEIYRGTGSITHAIERSHKIFCVSDFKTHQLLKIDQTGCVLSTITCSLGRTDFDPCCVSVDSINNVLTTDYNNNCVYLINSNDEIKELVGMSHGIRRPLWVSIDIHHNLWIGQEDGSVRIVKYLH